MLIFQPRLGRLCLVTRYWISDSWLVLLGTRHTNEGERGEQVGHQGDWGEGGHCPELQQFGFSRTIVSGVTRAEGGGW